MRGGPRAIKGAWLIASLSRPIRMENHKRVILGTRDFRNGEYEIITLPLKVTVLTTFLRKLLTFNQFTSHSCFENHNNEIRKQFRNNCVSDRA